MKSIWKYYIPTCSVEMPQGSKILSVHVQNALPHVWVLVEPEASLVNVEFHVVPTGWPVQDEVAARSFVGTILLHEGRLVFHVCTNGEVVK